MSLSSRNRTGKYHHPFPAEGRFAFGTTAKLYTDRYWHDRELNAVNAFVKNSRGVGVQPATLAVAWVMANPVITATIIGASKPDQLDASLAAAELKLDSSLKARLDELTHECRMGDAPR
ncbi:MAG: aldo/keto reductase [Deltaproteobacteria bacterium]|nr:aldo/keto reductase [Deltaproteobacteria bacterium]